MTKFKGSMLLVAVVFGLGLLASANSASADPYGYGSYGNYGYAGYRPGYGYGYGYQNNYNTYQPSYGATWHDTSHWDYHPSHIVPHRNHFHYVPGHYDYHQTGHWHW